MLLLFLQVIALYAITLGIPILIYKWMMWINFGDQETIAEGINRYMRGFGDYSWKQWHEPNVNNGNHYIPQS